MEGGGSRLGRASSRYGPSATAAVFNGPVRKWKKKWVHVGPSSSSTGNHQNSRSNAHAHNNNNNNSRLLLCRWTPLSPSTATDGASSSSSEEPPKRKFRYTPIAVLEERKKAAEKVDNEGNASGTDQSTALETPKNDELNSDSDLKTENQDSNMSNLDLGLCLKGHYSDHDSVGESNGDQMKKESSGGFWTPS
ncbi:uncharacterized protein LOC8268123 [Ricinus communis]|uniref:Uncharacterized protein n=1 Tax=Ricinus communis TaxID=3988 RepID=B9SYX9_RICCO|nr:uncharacterized protein LOC8268123 [Ricinus communis]EEF31175.1 conserved hypothetical protein [Ricinus communis]|eukprot:XP_002531198.1 uncharacterized protein LOC8268123 [Ricinus communis]